MGHDSILEDHCFLAGHVLIAGFVKVGPYCFLGPRSTTIDGLVIGERTMLGAGSVVMKDTEPGSVYVAERAKKLKIPSHRIRL